MSHISIVQTRLMDRDILLETLSQLGYLVNQEENREIRSMNRTMKVDFLVEIPFSAPIGFRKSKNGYKIVADWFLVQQDPTKFKQQVLQQYAYISVLKALSEQGFQIAREEKDEKNQIHLMLRRMNEP